MVENKRLLTHGDAWQLVEGLSTLDAATVIRNCETLIAMAKSSIETKTEMPYDELMEGMRQLLAPVGEAEPRIEDVEKELTP